MELLNLLTIEHPAEHRVVAIYQGDLTQLEPEEAVDYLVISALPGDYSPAPGSLIGSLYDKGIDVQQLFEEKSVDLRQAFSCWLSTEISSEHSGIQFKRILCFEPWLRGSPQEVVGDIFRSLAPFLGGLSRGVTVAMPVVTTGHLGEPVAEVLPPLVDAAVHWMSGGMPLKWLKIVAPSATGAATLRELFVPLKERYDRPPEAPQHDDIYDAFVSYAHADEDRVQSFVDECRQLSPSTRFFIDRAVLEPGAAWQQALYEGIDKCRTFVCFLSPSYLASKVCKDEFNIALFRSREMDAGYLFPVYLFSAGLPTYMKMNQFVDCREGDLDRLMIAAAELLRLV